MSLINCQTSNSAKSVPGYRFATKSSNGVWLFIHVIERGDVLMHDVCNLRLIRRHVGPVVVRAGALDGVVGVERGEVERCDIQEHKVPATEGVDRVESRVDAIGVV